jgi:hypothetical protein
LSRPPGIEGRQIGQHRLCAHALADGTGGSDGLRRVGASPEGDQASSMTGVGMRLLDPHREAGPALGSVAVALGRLLQASAVLRDEGTSRRLRVVCEREWGSLHLRQHLLGEVDAAGGTRCARQVRQGRPYVAFGAGSPLNGEHSFDVP